MNDKTKGLESKAGILNEENEMATSEKPYQRIAAFSFGMLLILGIGINSAHSSKTLKNSVVMSSINETENLAAENMRLYREQEDALNQQQNLKNGSITGRGYSTQASSVFLKENPVRQHYLPRPSAKGDLENNPSQGIQGELNASLQTRMSASSTLFNNTEAKPVNHSSLTANNKVANATIIGGGDNAAFLNSEPTFSHKKAGWITHPNFTVPAGEMISATLETAVNSQLPGMVRAVTTRNIYALQGNKPLIPAGSLLIGQYSSDIKMGQKRALISWNRLQLPSGILVAISSPSSDSIGRAGQGASHVDTHFVERFSQSALLSVLGFYAATTGVNGVDQFNSKSQFKSMLSESFQNASEQSLNQTMNIQPTMIIHQGEKINVFVAHDLSFYDALNGRV